MDVEEVRSAMAELAEVEKREASVAQARAEVAKAQAEVAEREASIAQRDKGTAEREARVAQREADIARITSEAKAALERATALAARVQQRHPAWGPDPLPVPPGTDEGPELRHLRTLIDPYMASRFSPVELLEMTLSAMRMDKAGRRESSQLRDLIAWPPASKRSNLTRSKRWQELLKRHLVEFGTFSQEYAILCVLRLLDHGRWLGSDPPLEETPPTLMDQQKAKRLRAKAVEWMGAQSNDWKSDNLRVHGADGAVASSRDPQSYLTTYGDSITLIAYACVLAIDIALIDERDLGSGSFVVFSSNGERSSLSADAICERIETCSLYQSHSTFSWMCTVKCRYHTTGSDVAKRYFTEHPSSSGIYLLSRGPARGVTYLC